MSEAVLVIINWLPLAFECEHQRPKRLKKKGRKKKDVPGAFMERALSQMWREAGLLPRWVSWAGAFPGHLEVLLGELSGPGAFVGSVTFCLQGPEQSVLTIITVTL